MLNDT